MRFSWKQLRNKSIRRRLSATVGLLFAIASSLVTAQPAEILLLASKQSPVYQSVAHSIEDRLAAQTNIDIVYKPETVDQKQLSQYDLVITIGTNATRKSLSRNSPVKILSTFIPKPSFDAISREYEAKIREQKLSALFLDQPLQRQLQLIKLISPEAKSIGTIVSSKSKQKIPELTLNTESLDLELVYDELSDNQNPVETLTPIISKSDAFLALPDRAVFNRSTAKWVLLMTFRQKIPLIAFSKSYVDAGALAAIYSTPATVGEETAAIVNAWINSGKQSLPKPKYPDLFSLSINESTANSLGIEAPKERQIIERLSQQ